MDAFVNCFAAALTFFAPSAVQASVPARTQQGFLNAAMVVAFGGVICFLLNSAPFIQPPYKQWATWLVLAGTLLSVLRFFT